MPQDSIYAVRECVRIKSIIAEKYGGTCKIMASFKLPIFSACYVIYVFVYGMACRGSQSRYTSVSLVAENVITSHKTI